MTKVIGIIGANGQIGSALVDSLCESELYVPIAIVRSRMAAYIIKERIGKKFEIRIGNITNPKESEIILKKIDIIINAAISTGNGFKKDRQINLNIFDVISKHKQINQLIHLSSVAVYGIKKESNFLKPRPNSSYGKEKLFHEKYLKKIFKSKSKKLVILRVGHLYCAGSPMSHFIVNSIKSPNFKLPFPDLSSNFVSRPRVVQGIIQSIKINEDFSILNLTDSPNLSYEDIFEGYLKIIKNKKMKRLSGEKALMLRSHHENRLNLFNSFIGKILSDLKTMLKNQIFNSPAFRVRLEIYLSKAPENFEKIIRTFYKKTIVGNQIKRTEITFSDDEYPEFLFWPKVPGPQIDVINIEKELDNESKKLINWYNQIISIEFNSNIK